jgi:hypothetical protein
MKVAVCFDFHRNNPPCGCFSERVLKLHAAITVKDDEQSNRVKHHGQQRHTQCLYGRVSRFLRVADEQLTTCLRNSTAQRSAWN